MQGKWEGTLRWVQIRRMKDQGGRSSGQEQLHHSAYRERYMYSRHIDITARSTLTGKKCSVC